MGKMTTRLRFPGWEEYKMIQKMCPFQYIFSKETNVAKMDVTYRLIIFEES